MIRTRIAFSLLLATAACGDKGGEAASGSAAASAAPSGAAAGKAGGATTADSKPARKAKTTLSSKQLKEAYDEVAKENDFKKHRDMITAKLGQPMKEDGDKAIWYGIQPAEGSQKEGCMLVYTSPTKGDQSSSTGDENCWE